MQAIERALISKDWITAVILLSFLILVLLKFLDQDRLKGYVLFYFNKGFLETESYENPSFFSVFNLLFSVFSSLTFSLFFLQIFSVYEEVSSLTFFNFSILFLILFGFQILQNLIQIIVVSLFAIKGETINTLLVSQRSFLFSVSVLVFVVEIMLSYLSTKPEYLIYITVFVAVAALIYFLNTNKKLIISKLFYFILYLCAFKLAPLLVLFKLIL